MHNTLFGIPIIFEHPEFRVLNKPRHLACHGPDTPNLAAILKAHDVEPLLCHRLDKDTSGLLIVAKTAQAAERFRLLFENKHIEKFYIAISHKKGRKKQGTIQGFMQKSRGGNWKLGEHADKAEKAYTQFFSFGNSETHTTQRIFVVKILGGQSHQIRVALKANGSPIMGDTRYGGAHAERLMLHAYGLIFDYAGERITLECPPDFVSAQALRALPFEHAGDLKWPPLP